MWLLGTCNNYGCFVFSAETFAHGTLQVKVNSCTLRGSRVRHFYSCLSFQQEAAFNTVYCKTLNICGIKFSRFNENDILPHFNFGGHGISWLQMVKKICWKIVTFFLNFLLNYILCHPLQSVQCGDSNGMPQNIVSWIVKKISNTHQVLHFYLRLHYALHIILADLYFCVFF